MSLEQMLENVKDARFVEYRTGEEFSPEKKLEWLIAAWQRTPKQVIEDAFESLLVDLASDAGDEEALDGEAHQSTTKRYEAYWNAYNEFRKACGEKDLRESDPVPTVEDCPF